MNYLKSISSILKWERDKVQAQTEACNIIHFIAEKMYDTEMDRTKYQIWTAIMDLTDAIKYRW